jgi:hypothetical protein
LTGQGIVDHHGSIVFPNGGWCSIYIYNTYIYIYVYIYIDIYIYITNWILTWLMFDMDHNLVSVVFHYFPHILSSWFNILNAHTWISLIFVWGCS